MYAGIGVAFVDVYVTALSCPAGLTRACVTTRNVLFIDHECETVKCSAAHLLSSE